jgi:hypothetical protein
MNFKMIINLMNKIINLIKIKKMNKINNNNNYKIKLHLTLKQRSL